MKRAFSYRREDKARDAASHLTFPYRREGKGRAVKRAFSYRREDKARGEGAEGPILPSLIEEKVREGQ